MVRFASLFLAAALSSAPAFSQADEIPPLKLKPETSLAVGDKGVVGQYPWVMVRNLVDFQNGEGDLYTYGTRCAVESGGVVTIVGFFSEQEILVRYEHKARQKGSTCPGNKGLLFTLTRDEFLKMKRVYDERSEVEKLLAKQPSQ